jgi:hypothetical protein
MSFFKGLRDAWNEGVKEAEAELAEEQSKKEQTDKSKAQALIELINGTPYEEKFGLALAAPFRAVYFRDWFTLFNDDDKDEEYPRHLFSISGSDTLENEDENRQMLRKLIERDFGIVDEQSAKLVTMEMFASGRIPTCTDLSLSEDEINAAINASDSVARQADVIYDNDLYGDDERKDALTLRTGMTAHAVCASANVGYITMEEAVSLLTDLGVFIKDLYGAEGTWEEYGKRFIDGNEVLQINNKKGMKQLCSIIEKLNKKMTSPWQLVPFVGDGENLEPAGDRTSGGRDEFSDDEPHTRVYSDAEFDIVETHIEESFGTLDLVMHEIVSNDIHLDVALVYPQRNKERLLLVTEGVGVHRMNVPEELDENNLWRMELISVLPSDWNTESNDEKDYWPIETLKSMGRYALENDTWLGWGHTVRFEDGNGKEGRFAGKPFVSYMLVSPLGYPDDARYCTLPDGTDVNFYQLISLYQSEMDYKIEHGAEALIAKFRERFGEDWDGMIDVARPNVAE